MSAGAGAQGGSVTTVEVRSAAGSYPVVVGARLLEGLAPELLARHAPAARYAVVSDARVASLHADTLLEACRAAGLRADLFTFEPGEPSKKRKTWSRLTDEILAAGVGRDGCVVALGGGVTGDLAGFVAATYMRGLPFVQLPTSLVAMIDASVGGKVGVDVAAGKNLVGAFHPPKAVVADVSTLGTLPREERAQGWVEALKHGAILDEGYFSTLEETGEGLVEAEPEATRPAVIRSIELKARVVGDDEREAGPRQILNFGHTLGHAIEAASGYRLGHGAAVAAGMVLEARLGERIGVTERGVAQRLDGAVAALGFELGAVRGVDRDDVRSRLGVDKKARGGRARYVLLERVGAVASDGAWSREVPAEAVEEVLEVAWSE